MPGISAIGSGSLWSLRTSVVSGGDFGGPVSAFKNPVPGGQGATGKPAASVSGENPVPDSTRKKSEGAVWRPQSQ